MSGCGTPAPGGGAPARPGRLGAIAFAGLLLVVGLGTVGLALVGDGNPVLPLAPALLVGLLFALVQLPLRWTCTALIFLLLAADGTGNAGGLWHTPWAMIGDLLTSNLDSVVPGLGGMKANGMELITLLLLGVAIYRRSAGVRIDGVHAQTASVVANAVLVCLAAVGYSAAMGLAHGGAFEVVFWQTRPMLETAMLFFLFQYAYRGAEDHALLARTLVAAAWVKAAIAVYVRHRIAIAYDNVEYTTSHGDSILFILAIVIPLAHLLERTDRRRLRDLALLSPLVLWGLVANNRRLAWVELGFTCATFFLLSPTRRWKRFVVRTGLVALPLVALYLTVGWNGTHRIFGPVRTIRSIVDTKTDRSSWDREVEDFNLATSCGERPMLGRGFGLEYTEFIVGDDISKSFPMFRALPHNMVLGLLLFAGALSFFAIWFLYPLTVFLAARAYRLTADPELRTAALVCISSVICVIVQCYGDMGLLSTQSKVVSAIHLAVIGKLATVTGAWPRRTRRSASTAHPTGRPTTALARLEPEVGP